MKNEKKKLFQVNNPKVLIIIVMVIIVVEMGNWDGNKLKKCENLNVIYSIYSYVHAWYAYIFTCNI